MNKIFGLLFIALFYASLSHAKKAEASLPADVQDIITRKTGCGHWEGEDDECFNDR